ncbi:MAG: hypothetical protein HY425_01655 [Candidatus Levybacteria bacterium]|nr:hypothetical protein [Candidatus Levybacteria bacterium]
MDGVKTEESWNKTRIFIASFLITLLAIGAYFYKTHFLDKSLSPKEVKSVKGVSLEDKNRNGGKNTNIDIQGTVKDKLDNLKQEVSGLNISEIASSSPQIQKIINDIKSLEQYPVNQIREVCRQICGL